MIFLSTWVSRISVWSNFGPEQRLFKFDVVFGLRFRQVSAGGVYGLRVLLGGADFIASRLRTFLSTINALLRGGSSLYQQHEKMLFAYREKNAP